MTELGHDQLLLGRGLASFFLKVVHIFLCRFADTHFLHFDLVVFFMQALLQHKMIWFKFVLLFFLFRSETAKRHCSSNT